jgi:fucose 4-O-acetylase-like acetyltransferase
MNNQRKNYVDIVRGIAIILVVFGHAGYPEYLGRFASFFHVPVFFFLSGLFYSDVYYLRPHLLIVKRLRSLYLPFVAYQVLFLMFHNEFFTLHLYSKDISVAGEYVRYYMPHDYLIALLHILTFGCTQQAIWGLWYLQSIFTVTILFLAVSWFGSNQPAAYEKWRFAGVYGIFSVGLLLIANGITLPRSLTTSFISLPFFYFGFLYKRHEADIPIHAAGLFVAVLLLALSAVLYDDRISLANNHLVSFPYFLLNALLGIYAVVCFSKLVAGRFNCSVLRFIGEKSLHILVLHILAFRSIACLQIAILDYPIQWLGKYPVIDATGGWWFVYGVTGVTIPVLVCYGARVIRRVSPIVFWSRWCYTKIRSRVPVLNMFFKDYLTTKLWFT